MLDEIERRWLSILLGVIDLIWCAALLWFAHIASTHRPGFRDPRALLPGSLLLLCIGIGLLLSRRWAAVAFAIICALLTLYYLIGSFVSLPFTILNLIPVLFLAGLAYGAILVALPRRPVNE